MWKAIYCAYCGRKHRQTGRKNFYRRNAPRWRCKSCKRNMAYMHK